VYVFVQGVECVCFCTGRRICTGVFLVEARKGSGEWGRGLWKYVMYRRGLCYGGSALRMFS
jgi:hypothetical protein